MLKSLLNIILYIVNDEHYRTVLSSHNSLYILIETLAKQRDQNVTKRIWSYLEKHEDSKKQKTSRIYVSYNWADEEFCKLFIDALRKCTNLPIWVDYEHTNELQDPWECLAPAIDSTTIIIVLVSNAYGQSKSNCQELTYATAKMQSSGENKPVIVIEAVPNFKFNRDWMNSLLNEREKIPYQDNIQELASNVANDTALSKHRKHSFIPFSSNNVTQSQVCTIA